MIEEGLVIISPWDHFARLPPALWPSFACLAAVSLLSSNTNTKPSVHQGCVSCVTCSYPELTEDHVLTRAYVKIFRIVTINAINKRF